MPDNVPAWLNAVIPNAHEGYGNLAIARLATEEMIGRGGFTLGSAAFANGEELDPSFTADEEDAVAPPFEWTAPPAGTQELILIAEDPDASGDEPLCHWLVWGLAPQQGKLLEGETPPRVGKNSVGNSEWLLPSPPMGESAHNYVFQLFAVDLPLALMPGATRKNLVTAMEGHVVAAALLTATYARTDSDEEE